MSDLEYRRCPHDDWKAGSAQIGTNPETGQPIEMNINGVSATLGIQAALMALGAAMKAGHEEDFLEKIILCLYGKVVEDPHSICPLVAILGSTMMLIDGSMMIQFDKDNKVVLVMRKENDPTGASCMYPDREGDDDDELHEGPSGGTGGTTEGGDEEGDGTGEGISGPA